MYAALPKNEKTFDFSHVGETTGEEYKGTFIIKCMLSISDRHNFEIEKTRLTVDFVNPSEGLQSLALLLASLRTRIIDAPEWWKQSKGGSDIMDEDVLYTLYDQVMTTAGQWILDLKKSTQKVTIENPPKESC
jgi:hypothetical protein